MGEKPNQIKREIDQTRAELGSNLQEMEYKIKNLTDWRLQFQQRPFTMIGLAFGGGVLLATTLGGHRGAGRSHVARDGDGDSSMGRSELLHGSDKATRSQMKRAADTIDTIKGALIGLAAGKVQGFLKETVPGFREEFDNVRQREHTEPVADTTPQL